MDYYVERLQKGYDLATQAKEEAARFFVRIETAQREVPMEPTLELSFQDPEGKELLAERDRLVAQAASVAAQVRDAFLTLWRIVPEETRWAFYARLHGLEMKDDKLLAFIQLRKDWPWEGILDASEFPAWEKEGERYYLVGSLELWKKRPLYLKNDSPLAKVRVIEGELPAEPEDYVRCQKIEIIEVL